MPPLPLNSPRWNDLQSHRFEESGAQDPSVPDLLARWLEAVGSYGEEYAYAPLFEAYLHQLTILNVAYAVVPHLATHLAELPPDRRLEVLADIAKVESVRLTPAEDIAKVVQQMERTIPEPLRASFIQKTRDHHPPLPEDLAPAYQEAIAQARSAALNLVELTHDASGFALLLAALCELNGHRALGKSMGLAEGAAASPREWKRHVTFLRSRGWRDDDIGFGVRALTYEEDGAPLVYQSLDAAAAALRAHLHPPPGWSERTKLQQHPERDLGFLALHAIAWLTNRVSLETMLA